MEKNLNIKYEFFNSIEELSAADRELVEASDRATAGAYAPYSGYRVGAAVRLADGRIVKGANQENAAYPSGICAERTAMFAASSQFPDIAQTAIAITARDRNGNQTNETFFPCGACRQIMAEYQNKGGRPMEVLVSFSCGIYKFSDVADILPFAFSM